jgi:outer membrane protein assembly factor BamB
VKAVNDIAWQHPIGGGHAGIAVAGQVAITIEQRGEHEAVVAYNVETGKPVWVHQYPAGFHHSEPMGGDGPRTTPTIVDGLVYTLGAQGHLHCIEAASCKVKWQQNILEDAGAKNLEWGMSGTPLVVGDKVIVNPGIDQEKKTQQAVIAYDRMTGKKAWSAGSDMASYSSMMKANLAGVDQLLLFDAAGLKGLDPSSGKQLWLYPWKSSFDMNCAQPITLGTDQVYISSQVANGGAMLKLSREGDAWKATELWKNKYLGINFSNAVLHEGHLYGLSNGYLTCLDAKTGERKWKARQTYGNGQILIAGEVLVITAEDGFVALVDAKPELFSELRRIPIFKGRTWNVPAIARGRLYLRNHQEMACLKLW